MLYSRRVIACPPQQFRTRCATAHLSAYVGLRRDSPTARRGRAGRQYHYLGIHFCLSQTGTAGCVPDSLSSLAIHLGGHCAAGAFPRLLEPSPQESPQSRPVAGGWSAGRHVSLLGLRVSNHRLAIHDRPEIGLFDGPHRGDDALAGRCSLSEEAARAGGWRRFTGHLRYGLHDAARRATLAMNRGDLLTICCAGCYAAHILTLNRYSAKPALNCCPSPRSGFRRCWPGRSSAGWKRPHSLDCGRMGGDRHHGRLRHGYGLYFPGMGATIYNSTRTALIFMLEPVFAWITSYLLTGETLSARAAAGAVLILAGILAGGVETLPSAGASIASRCASRCPAKGRGPQYNK